MRSIALIRSINFFSRSIKGSEDVAAFALNFVLALAFDEGLCGGRLLVAGELTATVS